MLKDGLIDTNVKIIFHDFDMFKYFTLVRKNLFLNLNQQTLLIKLNYNV